MPTYEYSCEKCGKNFDVFQSMSDETFKECPKDHCQMKRWGHGRVKRLLGTGAGLIFKGSGFYITDYRSNNYKEGAKKEAPAATSTGGGEKSSASKEGGTTAPSPAAAAPAKTSESKPKKSGSDV
jgi:putative FmdB family regulatory protein